jgi:DNA-binding NarL/FixJ family response regulator
VLLADDHPEFLAVVARLLEANYEVVAAVGDGESLLREAARLPHEVVILDITMPGLDGFETARRLTAEGGPAAVVFLTVHSDPDYVRAAQEAGALGYVVKNRLTSDLLPGVREALAGRRYVSPSIHPARGGAAAI